jgi:hypothetical protein
MVVKYIEQLRRKSDNEKKRFLIISTSIILGTVIFVWLVFGVNLIPKEARPVPSARTEKGVGIFTKFFNEASQDLTKVKNDATDILGNFFEGKYDGEKASADLEGIVPDADTGQPFKLPKTE